MQHRHPLLHFGIFILSVSWGPFLESPETFSHLERNFVKLQPAYYLKLVLSSVVKGIKIKIAAKFLGSRRLRFEDTKIIISPEVRPKSFGTFEKWAPGLARGTNSRYCLV